MRRKRSLQSLAVAPKPPFGKDAANDGKEPIVQDAARCLNVSLHEFALGRKLPTMRKFRVAYISRSGV